MTSLAEQFRATFGPDSGLEGCDFRPHFDGWLWNAFRLLPPSTTREADMNLVWGYAREMAEWILGRRDRFAPGDRFHLIVGWPESVRPTARQIVKLGGGFDEVARLAAAESFADFQSALDRPVFYSGWDQGIYE